MKQLLLNSGWCLLATVLSRIGTLLSLLLIIRWLGSDAYGQIAIVQSTILMAGGSLGIGLGMAATKCVAEDRAAAPSRAGGILLLLGILTIAGAFLAAIVLVCARQQLSEWSIGSPQLSSLLGLSAPLLMVTTYNFYQVGVLSGFDSFRHISYANGLGALVSIPMIVVGVRIGEVPGAIAALTLGMVATCIIFHYYIRRACDEFGIVPRLSHAWANHKLVWRFCVPAVLTNVITSPIDWIGFALLARQPMGVQEVGVYCTANQWCLMLRFLPLAVGAALMTSIAAASTQFCAEERRRTARFGIGFAVAMAIPASVALALISPWIMRCYGQEFAGRWPVLAILMLAAAAISIQLACERILSGLGRMWTCFWLNLARGVLFCVAAAWCVSFGAEGLAVSRSATCALHAVVLLAVALAVSAKPSISRNRYDIELGETDGLLPGAKDKALQAA